LRELADLCLARARHLDLDQLHCKKTWSQGPVAKRCTAESFQDLCYAHMQMKKYAATAALSIAALVMMPQFVGQSFINCKDIPLATAFAERASLSQQLSLSRARRARTSRPC